MTRFKTSKLLIIYILITLPTFSQVQEKNFNKEREHATSLRKAGIDLLYESRYQEARDTFLLELELRKKIYGEENYNLGYTYSLIGLTYRNLGKYDEAIDYLNLSEKSYLLDTLESTNRSLARLYSNFGNVYRDKLDFVNALRYFNRVLTIYQEKEESSPADIANINYKISEIYYVTNEYDKALELIRNNIDYADDDERFLYYELLAFINQLNGNFEEAKENYAKVIEMTMEIDGETHLNTARSYLNYALFLISENFSDEAVQVLNKAYNIIKITQPMAGMDLSYYHDLNGYLMRNKPIETQDIKSFSSKKTKNLESALDSYFKALIALQFEVPYTPDVIENSDNWISLMDCIGLLKKIADTHSEIASVYRSSNTDYHMNSLKNAIENYQIAGSIIQKARREISGDESKIQLTELEYSTFTKLIEVAYDAYVVSEDPVFIDIAFQSTERTKSSSVFDNISNEFALENSIIPDSLIEKEELIKNKIAYYNELIFQENNETDPDSALIDTYTTAVFEIIKERDDLNQFMEKEYSDYYDLKYSASLFSLREVQKKLNEDEIILEYSFSDTDSVSELYTFLISKNKASFHKQIADEEFQKHIENVFYFMSNREYMFTKNSDSKAFCVSSYNLYQKLIAPCRKEIQNKRVIIVPDGKLSYIPFEGFLQELPDTTSNIQFNQLDYLIRDLSVNYANSSNILFKLHSPRQSFKNDVIAFAPVYQEDSIEIANRKYVLFPLPGVQKEVQQISEIVNTKLYVGEEATETNFRNYIENYDILHLAMHAFINDSLPAFSKLAFAQTGSTDNLSDGQLNTTDIYNFKLNAKLTVLSACNTGSGKLRKGEGIMSLARGFFYAGCPSLIMSLWEVEDESGTQIMSYFYKNLKRGQAKDEALRMAKLEYLEKSNSRRAHPHYWLGYINMGDRSPLYKSYDFYFFAILLLLILGVVTDQIIKMRNESRLKKRNLKNRNNV